ncbi:hypothetical protein [Streptomyces acidiscabies]|uniref:Lipoprotein n=1 Tax=Streptomyces acidiscabies TaxID=42234 RepID=A0AAP6B757_9ACTN|nr:hypothetical protein [Streptomyces acidiscabies]MBP5939298.1 hypothetical protein [Streptomyces sp. LBUM 1476]MBZ3910431.1 hypothetical protein [Streptomyces acidiscabies]MDX2959429.1 hypothetical protein [Streptomyces acidiscabies]MDX3019283.1 hypothetical protein [Streptomyces acidiscabies]MDX3790636.1 hypothetical protein [Streptomyces acidiscabies]
MRRSLVLALVALTMLAAACGEETTTSGRHSTSPDPAQRTERARQVAAAWNGSRAEASWRAGYHPLGDWTALPEGLRNPLVTLRATLPPLPRPDAEVRWPDGSTLKVPLTPASTAYEALDRYEGPSTQVPVTAVTLGTMPLQTSRGPATVPAWLFTVEGYASPIRRAAVRPSARPKSPIGAVSSSMLAGQVGGIRGRALTIVVPHSPCDDGVGVEVLETPGSVVLSPYTVNPRDGACAAVLKMERVRVDLDRPLSDRVLLDASTGAPMPYDMADGSPSWS